MDRKTAKSKLSSFGKATLSGAGTALTVIHNTPLKTRIYEIDEQIENLQQEKAELEKRLIDG